MLHAYDQRFDVTGNLENFCELNKAIVLLPNDFGLLLRKTSLLLSGTHTMFG